MKIKILLAVIFTLSIIVCKTEKVEAVEITKIKTEQTTTREPNSAKYYELVGYASKGDIRNVKALIKSGVSVNSNYGNSDEEDTPLLVAVYNGDLAMIKILVEAGADINVTTNWNMTAIDFANRRDIAEYLIEQGTDTTRLNIADYATYGWLDKVKESLKNGESIESTNGNLIEYTPLRGASSNGHLIVVEYLLEQGADIDAKDREREETALTVAVQSGQLTTVKYLVEQGADIETKDMEGSTPLDFSVYYGHLDIVKYLVGQGAEVKDIDSLIKTASYSKHKEIIDYLNTLK